MKRLLALFLAALMCVTAGLSLAEAPPPDAPEATDRLEPKATTRPDAENEEFVIGATTRLSGMFFTNMWGNNTADIDVRTLIHGYSPVVWTQQSQFEINPVVVRGLTFGEYEDGNKIYVVGLQNDLKYSDGSAIKAQDYVFSLMLFASPIITELEGMTTNSSHIKGYDEYRAGETDVFTGLRIVDDYTFSIEIKSEYLPFFYELGMLDAIPYPMSVIAPGCEVVDVGNGVKIQNIDETITEPIFSADLLQETVMDPDTGYLSHPKVTSGPYKLKSFDWDTREARFTINENFKSTYDGARPTIDNLVFCSVTPEDMTQTYLDGEVQILNKVVAGENIEEGLAMLNEGEALSISYPRMGFGFLSFSNEQGPFQFEAVRKAVAYSMDVPEYVREYSTFAVDVYGYMGIGQWMYLLVQGSDTPAFAEDEEDIAAWAALSLDNLNTYAKDLNTAKQLLIDDGWTLNEAGEPFQEGTDEVRYKMVDGELMGLIIKWAKTEDSVAAEMIDDVLPEALAEIGMKVEVTELPFTLLLEHYYRQVDRTYDMMYLATNFISIFDPYFVFNTDEKYQGSQNTTGFRDEELEKLALELRQTPPGELLEYCQKWVKFQEYFNEKLPMLPLYSNIYFDFCIPELMNYRPDAEMNWPVAIVHAYIGEKPEWLVEQEAYIGATQGSGTDGNVVAFDEP